METFDPGPLGDVGCEAGADRWTLVFVRDLRHPPAKVWAALTDPAQLGQWSPFTSDRNLGTTGDATLTMVDSASLEEASTEEASTEEASPEVLTASVRRAEQPTLLEYTWGPDLLRWELVAVGSGTRLTLRHTVEDRELVSKVAAGWHLCLVVADHLLDGRPIAPIRGEDAMNYGWKELNDAYAEKLDG